MPRIFGLLFFAFSCAATVALADSCPVKIESFTFLQQGRLHRADSYVIRLSNASERPLDVQVSLLPSDYPVFFHAIIDETVGVSRDPAFLVTVPHGVVVNALMTSLSDGSSSITSCANNPLVALSYVNIPPEIFDDSPALYDDLAAARVERIVDAAFVDQRKPSYPKEDVYACHTGAVQVELTIGKGGNLRRAFIREASGYPGLDAAALAAAQSSTFTAAHLTDGSPITLDYDVAYTFSLTADFVQRTGLKNCPMPSPAPTDV